MKKLSAIFVLLFISAFSVSAQSEPDHEYAPLQEKEIKYEDWTYKNVLTDENLNLRDYSKDKKLVMIFYYAPWCRNSNFQLPFTEKMYEKYKDQGLGIVGVSIYASVDKVKEKLKFYRINFPVVAESVLTTDRLNTNHYKYRTRSDDKRKWGTPFNVFFVPGKSDEKDDVLAKKAFVANGELMEKETESFIREKLGLSN